MKTVDTHAHVFSANTPAVSDARYKPTADASVESYLSHLDRHGFDYGVLIQPSFLGFDNAYMLGSIQQHPDRLKGVAVLPNDVDARTLDGLGARGIVGARLNLFGKPIPDLESSEWRTFLGRLGERDWQLELHCPPDYLTRILPSLEDYVGPVVIDHFGRVDPEAGTTDPSFTGFLDLLNPERHWVKLSGFYRLGEAELGQRHAERALELLLNKGMRKRLVWGSDWPHTQHNDHMDYDKAVRFLDKLVPDKETQKQILSDNALRLFEFDRLRSGPF